MAKDVVRYGYALLDDGNYTVSINDIDRPFTRLHKFYCPHCRNEMYATFGETQAPHFRHNGEKCTHSKYLHDLAEHVFYEEYSKCLNKGLPFYLELRIPRPCNKACVLKDDFDCREHYLFKTFDLTKDFTLISLETRVDLESSFRRPDILLESFDGNQLWVEIWVSHETEIKKRSDGRIIEIKVENEDDLNMIRQHKIIQSVGEDNAVRVFNIVADVADALFAAEEEPCYPCERYYCFEANLSGSKEDVIDDANTNLSKDYSYRIVLRLNWFGRHDSAGVDDGKQKISRFDLKNGCTNRFKKEATYLGKRIDSLIVSEWRKAVAPIIKAPAHPIRPLIKNHRKPSPQRPPLPSNPTQEDMEKMEWVDLGLPSGTLWANEDACGSISFEDARRIYGVYLPSNTNANELCKYCTKQWDHKTGALVLTGPSGKSISFRCKESYKSYWLKNYERGDRDYGQCFHIGQDKSFFINDKEVDSLIYVRLVR